VTVAHARWLGALGIAFYAGHAGRRALLGHPEHLLWMCHVAALLVATGLLAEAAVLNAVGTQWLVTGVPLWLADLAAGGEFFPTSVLSHVGGLLLGLVGLRRLGVPRGTWWKSAVLLAALTLLTRALTPASENVNLGFSVLPDGVEPWRRMPVAAAAVAGAALAFLGIERALLGLGFRRTEATC